MKSVELFIERLLMASRWVLVVFYLGLAAALVVYAVSFLAKFVKIAGSVFVLGDADMILAMLALIDAALVASLIVMVMLAGYENFVSRIDQAAANAEISWLGKLDAGSLKIKVASSIVAISSIHLLQVFLNLQNFSSMQLLWATLIHLTFVVSALILAILDRIVSYGKDKGAADKTAV
ncbi:TIGR00645 family protein [Pseudoxanthobacter sp. M-2]|uniref:TIGR00645 family protein n=1 Tax=Pseudoxanthobacter sp. M-2 TaxID=3078754 RepID=UPI0038FD2FA9